jgi:hypothetical protein
MYIKNKCNLYGGVGANRRNFRMIFKHKLSGISFLTESRHP